MDGEAVKIYLASSWRNLNQPAVLLALREAGHLVYDFRHPEPGSNGFAWAEIDPDWLGWTPESFIPLLDHQVARDGFSHDMIALEECDACVLLLPCGRSAHLEAGWAAGAKKKVYALLDADKFEPELMYRMLDGLLTDLDELIEALAAEEPNTYSYTLEPYTQICRVCGCNDDRACDGGCSWVAPNLCSRCGPSRPEGDGKGFGEDPAEFDPFADGSAVEPLPFGAIPHPGIEAGGYSARAIRAAIMAQDPAANLKESA